ncbi:MAG: methyltransferase, partial [Melioribacteraceae bacterium]|nr:methyltransferase [Melioribacteraceae bacterium]
DLYCGAGTISIFISKYVKQVFGFESVAAAIQDASVNNSLNKIDNTSFFISDLNKGFAEIINNANIPHPDIIITDPPRSGMHQNTIQDIINLNPPKIVYVSCNPATQARDIRLLNDSGYKIEKIRPVDMFPHTYHIENVVLLTR